MVSGTHRLLIREGRNNRSNPDFQTFLRGLYEYRIQIHIQRKLHVRVNHHKLKYKNIQQTSTTFTFESS